jgi:predicted transcriptional regulator of viral defense system
MIFLEFKEKVKEIGLFETRELRLVLGADFSHATLNNLKNWVNKGYLIMLRRGLYILSDLKSKIDPMMAASKLYFPSYISLEYALGYYDIIPEIVFTVTSVTTRKTKKFKTGIGYFSYQKIKKEAFGGFETVKQDGIAFNLALPEKALVDFFYLNRNIIGGSRDQFEGYRFNEDFEYNRKRLVEFAEKYDNRKVLLLTQKFIEYYVAK